LERATVLLVQVSGVLGDIVKREGGQRPDRVEFVGELDDDGRVLEYLRHTPADVVVFGLRRRGPEETGVSPVFRAVLTEHPRTTIFAVEDDGRRSFLYELRPHKVPLGEISAAELLEAVASAAGRTLANRWALA
jgi:DNA-binding NarL/FixJ family response regulator